MLCDTAFNRYSYHASSKDKISMSFNFKSETKQQKIIKVKISEQKINKLNLF